MRSKERSNRPPRTLVAFSGALLLAGARLPLYPFIKGVIVALNLAPMQLNPNAYWIMCSAFILFNKMKESDLTIREF